MKLDMLALPAVSRPTKWPCPWLQDSEVETYLFPLYQRGWYVSNEIGKMSHALRLKKTFEFKNATLALEFAVQVFHMMEALKVCAFAWALAGSSHLALPF